jgi:hypothetical protein
MIQFANPNQAAIIGLALAGLAFLGAIVAGVMATYNFIVQEMSKRQRAAQVTPRKTAIVTPPPLPEPGTERWDRVQRIATASATAIGYRDPEPSSIGHEAPQPSPKADPTRGRTMQMPVPPPRRVPSMTRVMPTVSAPPPPKGRSQTVRIEVAPPATREPLKVVTVEMPGTTAPAAALAARMTLKGIFSAAMGGIFTPPPETAEEPAPKPAPKPSAVTKPPVTPVVPARRTLFGAAVNLLAVRATVKGLVAPPTQTAPASAVQTKSNHPTREQLRQGLVVRNDRWHVITTDQMHTEDRTKGVRLVGKDGPVYSTGLIERLIANDYKVIVIVTPKYACMTWWESYLLGPGHAIRLSSIKGDDDQRLIKAWKKVAALIGTTTPSAPKSWTDIQQAVSFSAGYGEEGIQVFNLTYDPKARAA